MCRGVGEGIYEHGFVAYKKNGDMKSEVWSTNQSWDFSFFFANSFNKNFSKVRTVVPIHSSSQNASNDINIV